MLLEVKMLKKNKSTKKIVSKKEIKKDLIGIALLHLAQKAEQEMDKYTKALEAHIKEKYKLDNADDWTYEGVFEKCDFEELIKLIQQGRSITHH